MNMIDNAINQNINNQVVQEINNVKNFKFLEYSICKIEYLNVTIQKDLSSTIDSSSPFEGTGKFSYNDGNGVRTEWFRFSGSIDLDGYKVTNVYTPPFTLFKK